MEGKVHNELDGHVHLDFVNGDRLVRSKRYDRFAIRWINISVPRVILATMEAQSIGW